ncbi:cytochrome P450 [Streptomyces sp. H10-C2]|uniref:cytochrome P450 n=1 Tax=unclassified Streptomyces TaxID=2593676 RepID=UPI0024BB9123|nr:MULTISPECIES: cytochrome P450 [unclassified Streptomyces]MDJ0341868.1 cytochrome P450 [Streptomyces sp. PH10-H1]MDJ0370378.1 cytochrome P450 [Streptomyces sp. H10-C2]
MAEADTRQIEPEAPAYPMQRTCPYQPPAGYEQLREQGPLARVTLFDGRTAWVVAGNDEGRALLPDPRLSVDVRNPDFPLMAPRIEAQRERATPLIGVDDPEHARQRRMSIPGFGIRRVNALRPEIEKIADTLIDRMTEKGSSADLVTDFALPLPSAAICLLLGIPFEDHDYFAERSRHVLSSSGEEQAAQAQQAFGEILTYLYDLIGEREADPRDGLLDELISQRLLEGAVDRNELAMIATVLLVSGHETTANMIGISVLTLLEHPQQLAALRADPALMPGAVDELFRFTSIGDTLPRVATEDIEVGGQLIKAGDGVIVSNMLMNRDPSAFENADQLDIRRAAGRHVAFGFGIHQCIGQNLARAEMEIALERLFTRLPNLRLAIPASEVQGKPAFVLQGVEELPVTW